MFSGIPPASYAFGNYWEEENKDILSCSANKNKIFKCTHWVSIMHEPDPKLIIETSDRKDFSFYFAVRNAVRASQVEECFTGAFLLILFLLPYMVVNQYQRIVNIALIPSHRKGLLT